MRAGRQARLINQNLWNDFRPTGVSPSTIIGAHKRRCAARSFIRIRQSGAAAKMTLLWESEETAMKRFGVLLASAALGAALAASGPALAFGGGHMGGGFGGGGHMAGFGGGHMFAGRSVATGSFNRGFGFNRGFNRGFNNRFAHFHHFHNRFAFFPFYGGGWDYSYPYADCGYWGGDYCGNGYSNYAYSYPDYGYDSSYYDNGYADDYGYPATGSSGYYAAAPLVTGRSVATGQLGSYCTISVKTCELQHPSYVGGACSCRVPGGRAGGLVTR
jgi:hypothetical protein